MTEKSGFPAALTRHAVEILGVLGCVILVVAIAAAAWMSYRQQEVSERAFQLQHAESTALVLQVHAHDTLASVDDAVRRLKRSYERDGMRIDMHGVMEDYRDIADYVAVASIADEQGRLIRSTLPIPPGASIADLEHFRVHVGHDSGEAYINKPLLGRLSGKWSFHVTRRINRADGSFGGVAIVAVDFSYWSHLLQDGNVSGNNAIVLVGRDGVARASHGSQGLRDELMKADWSFLLRQTESGNTRGSATTGAGAPARVSGSWVYRSLTGYPLIVAVSVDERALQPRLDAIGAAYVRGVMAVAILAALFAAALLLLSRRQRTHAAERMRIAEAWEESEGRFKTMFDHAGIGISLRPAHDRALPWIAVNDKFCEMTGYSREELLRLSTAEITPTEGQDAALRDNQRLLSGEISSYAREKQLLCKDGSVLWVTLSVAVLPGADGKPQQIMSTYQDITARKETEERLRAIIAAEPECVAIVAPDGELLDMNPAGLRMLQADSLEEMRRWPFLKQVAPQYRRAFVRLQRRILAGESGMLEFEAVGISGKRCWLEIHGAPLHDASGAITALLGIARDVTDRRTAREALAAERKLLRTVIDNLPDRIRVKNRDLRFTLANTAWMKARAPGHHDVAGLRNRDLLPPALAAIADAEDREVLATGRPSRPREIVDGPTDDPRWFITTKRPLLDEMGSVFGVVAISRDVTDFKRRSIEVEKLNIALEARVAERTMQLTTANEELEAFASSVSHDLRAPLRHIDGLALALQEDYAEKLDAPGQGYLERIRAAAVRMSGLIEDLLRLSRVSRTSLELVDVNLTGIVRTIADELRRDHPQREVKFRIEPGLQVQADRGLLQSALANLIHNAWKFTGNKPVANIEFGTMQHEDMTVYFVRDDGAGFDMKNAGRLFDAFQRLHAEREFPGTGIGLATVRRIIRRHGGEVWAESEVGKGATFYFTLNRRPVPADAMPAGVSAATDTAGAWSPAAVTGAAAAEKNTVLLVDDDPDVLVLTARALTLDGYPVLTAARGEEALAALREHAVSVVVSDFSMPGMNGAQLLAQVAALYPDTLRLIVSGQTMNRAMQTGLRKGEIHHYFEKQHSYDAVRSCIRTWLASRSGPESGN